MKNLMIASWYKSECNVDVHGVKIDLLIRGNTHFSGWLFSRLYERLLNPNWEVATLVICGKPETQVNVSQVLLAVDAAMKYMEENEIKWTWLAIVSEDGFAEDAIHYTKKQFVIRNLGLVLVDLKSKIVHHANNFLSMSLTKYIKF
jgi:nitrate reductase NapAB chaperone NapD